MGLKVDVVGFFVVVLLSVINLGYVLFKSIYVSCNLVVYVGVNDGMMYVFDGIVGCIISGNELFVYVLSFLY